MQDPKERQKQHLLIIASGSTARPPGQERSKTAVYQQPTHEKLSSSLPHSITPTHSLQLDRGERGLQYHRLLASSPTPDGMLSRSLQAVCFRTVHYPHSLDTGLGLLPPAELVHHHQHHNSPWRAPTSLASNTYFSPPQSTCAILYLIAFTYTDNREDTTVVGNQIVHENGDTTDR